MKRTFFTGLLVILIYGCSPKEEHIKSIKFAFGLEGTQLAIAAACTPESFELNFGDELQFKTNKDSIFIHKFSTLLKTLKPDNSREFIDARIMAIISYEKSNKKDTICFGEFHGIDLNGTFMVDNEELLNLVKEEVWFSQNQDSIIYNLPYFKEWTSEEIEMFLNSTKT